MTGGTIPRLVSLPPGMTLARHSSEGTHPAAIQSPARRQLTLAGPSNSELALRNLTAAVAVALVTALGIASPVAAIQTSSAKVVIIVGATHGATANYRANGDAAYAEAI